MFCVVHIDTLHFFKTKNEVRLINNMVQVDFKPPILRNSVGHVIEMHVYSAHIGLACGIYNGTNPLYINVTQFDTPCISVWYSTCDHENS